jgi:hypothetical protein
VYRTRIGLQNAEHDYRETEGRFARDVKHRHQCKQSMERSPLRESSRCSLRSNALTIARGTEDVRDVQKRSGSQGCEVMDIPNFRRRLHTPVPDPQEDEEEPEVRHPPVPPDREDEVIPQREPPNPGESLPMIAWSRALLGRLAVAGNRNRGCSHIATDLRSEFTTRRVSRGLAFS